MTATIKYFVIGIISAVLLFFAGRWTKDCTDGETTITLTDTLEVKETKFVPSPYAVKEKVNVDSISAFYNKFWADSLGEMYGRGMFVVTTKKQDEYGTREYQFNSRIPIDPEGIFIVNEKLNLPNIYPKSTIGLFAGIENRFDENVILYGGLKYYVIDSKHFQLYAKGSVNYQMLDKKFDGRIALQTEIKL